MLLPAKTAAATVQERAQRTRLYALSRIASDASLQVSANIIAVNLGMNTGWGDDGVVVVVPCDTPPPPSVVEDVELAIIVCSATSFYYALKQKKKRRQTV